jgi:16S rRNA G1207 methylase RsmC
MNEELDSPTDALAAPHIRPQEQLLLTAAEEMFAGRILCNTAGRGQFARHMALQHASASVTCLLLDLHQYQQTLAAGPKPKNLRLVCETDPPDERFDVVALALNRSGEAELARELLQAGHVRLVEGGQLVATTDNPRDIWLEQQMKLLFDRVSRKPSELGVTYTATKRAPLKRIRRFEAEFPFRDGGRLLKLRTRPGVFSHRHVDGGARALLAQMRVEPGMRVLDIGTGSGVVAVAAAARAEGVEVLAIDSHSRAIEAVRWAAEANDLPLVRASLDADGRTVEPACFDLVLANPPYYSNFRIAEIFMATATKALRPGGQLLVVTKRPEWYADRLQKEFRDFHAEEVRRYFVCRAIRSAQ